MAKLSLRHVSKRYPNGFWAVKDFNLEMEDGEFVILTGSPKAENHRSSYDRRSRRCDGRHLGIGWKTDQ